MVPGLDLPALERYLDAPLSAELIAGGKSNLTYRLVSGARTWVLRRPPLGNRLPTAHDMAREYTILRALADTEVPVPRVLSLCEDETVIGAPFYVMEEVLGRIVRRPSDVASIDPSACSAALVDTLRALHEVDYEAVGLGSFGRPAGFMSRQVRRWHEQLERGRARPLPELDELGLRLASRVPGDGRFAVVHGDYRIDNVVLDDDSAVRAVLDWEMATLGDPLADVGMLLMYWRRPGDAMASEIHAITAEPGFFSREEVAERYGVALRDVAFYVAFAHFKLAVIVEGIHTRALAGNTVGDGFDEIAAIGPALAREGLAAL